MTPNERAFLEMLAFSEGTDMPGHAPGYDVIVGSTPSRRILIKDMARHPNVAVQITETLWSTAAGRYQIIFPSWVGSKAKAQYGDFGGEAQDAWALYDGIQPCGALDMINVGKIPAAITACRHIWASLPDAGYGQHQNKLSALLMTYQKAGGVVA